MDKEAAIAGLRALASSQSRNKTALLRDVIDDVEAALKAGVKREAVVQELSRNGLEMKLSAFDSALRRLRRQPGKSITKGAIHAASRRQVAAKDLPKEIASVSIHQDGRPIEKSTGFKYDPTVDPEKLF